MERTVLKPQCGGSVVAAVDFVLQPESLSDAGKLHDWAVGGVDSDPGGADMRIRASLEADDTRRPVGA
eukprot:CAMPEP_0196768760 /NCGR_PEP_ID=MMETSP1104-20130614/95_1 /TAXON_ID=33652 /ORGANISM="Cafeteria sp., Strain Caron Lab Isolate" /LENGTH=67 /DNA_ID=CAMNT_0042138833 /DNA_START=24 /DNA_END=225 /DNA_ORIENTATION=+